MYVQLGETIQSTKEVNIVEYRALWIATQVKPMSLLLRQKVSSKSIAWWPLEVREAPLQEGGAVQMELGQIASQPEHKTCDILAAERLQLMRFDNQLIIDSLKVMCCSRFQKGKTSILWQNKKYFVVLSLVKEKLVHLWCQQASYNIKQREFKIFWQFLSHI